MSQNFIKSLDPYENNSGKPIKGKYHFDIPHDIEPACYTMNIDYESHDEVNPDAYQYDGYIVIGYNSYLRTYVVHVPFDTTATTEEGVTLYEKRNTTFNAICDAFKNSDFTSPIKNLPLEIRFKKGVFKDYYNLDQSVWLTDYNSAYEPVTKPNPHNTDNNGKTTTNFKVSDVYSAEETINDLNTLFFRLKGTRNRGNDNYVPNIIPIACILGTTTINLKQTTSDFTTVTSNDVNFELPSSSINVAATCGHGKQKLGMNILYKFALNDQYLPKVGYEDYYTDNDFYCKVGKLQLQYKTDNEWITVPASQLSAADTNTIVDSEGYITQKQGSEQGGVQVYWTNPLRTDTSKLIQYRWKYTGKPGATFGAWGTAYNMVIDPQYGTPVQFNSRLVMNQNTFTGTPGSPIQVCGKLQQKEGGVWVDATEGQGIVTVELGDGTTQTATVNANGTFCVNVTSEGGEYDITVSYNDPNGLYKDASTTIHLSVESTETRIQIDDEFTGVINGNVSLTGKVVTYYNGTTHDITNGTGKITGVYWDYAGDEYEREVNINSNGTFTLQLPTPRGGVYEVDLTFTDSTLKFAESSNTTTIIVPCNVSIQLSSNSINVLNGDSFSVNGTVVLNDGVDDFPYYRVGSAETISNSLNSSKFTIASDGTFTATGTAPNNTSTNIVLTFAGNKELKSATKTLTVTAGTSNVNIRSSTTSMKSYDTGTSDSSDVTLTLTDSNGNPVKKGTVELYIRPTNAEYQVLITEPFNVKQATVPSTGIVTFNAYDFASTAKSTMNGKGILFYTKYNVTVKYTDSSGSYNSSTSFTNNDPIDYWYQVKSPKVRLEVSVKPHSSNSYTPIYENTFTSFGEDGDLSLVSPIPIGNNSDIQVIFDVLDSSNNRIGNIPYTGWVTNEYNVTGYCGTETSRNPCREDAKRTVKVVDEERSYVNPTTGENVIFYKDEPTDTLKNPTYAGISLIEDEYNIDFKDVHDLKEKTSTVYPCEHTFNLFEDIHGESVLFFGLSVKSAAGIFNKVLNNVVVYPTESLVDGVDWNSTLNKYWYINPKTHSYGVFFRIKFNSASS